MSIDSFVGVQPDSSGKSIDAEQTNTGAGLVYRQRIVIDGEKFDRLLELQERMLLELQCVRVILNEGFELNVRPEDLANEESEGV